MGTLKKSSLFAFLLSAISMVALAVCLYVHYSVIQVDWSRTKDASDVFKNIAEILAIIGGATWAFFRFRKGRTYQETLGLKVSGRLIPIAGVSYLLITTQLKNLGLSNVEIRQQGTAIIVLSYRQPTDLSETLTVEQELLAVFPVFEKDTSVEPNESIEDERLIAIPVGVGQALRIEFSVSSSGGYTWEAATIVHEAQSTEVEEQ